MAKENGGSSAFLVGFLLGATSGVVAALMMAPRPGDETIGQIRERGMQLKMRAEEMGNQALQQASDQANRFQAGIQTGLEDLDARSQDVARQAEVQVQETLDQLEELEEAALDAGSDDESLLGDTPAV